MKQLTLNNSRGLTLTELLAVMMIISLLATIAVPVYVARQEDARIRVAQGECREIAMAEETVAAMHGFYVPFQLLDELPAKPEDLGDREERIDRNPFANNIYLIIPTIRAEDQVIPANIQRRLIQGYTTGGVNDALVRRLVDNWSGPFLNFQRFWYDTRGFSAGGPYDGPTDPRYRQSDDMFKDYPLDPWGNPYRFYSPYGIIGDAGDNSDERANEFNYENPDLRFSSGRLTNDDNERFQRYAVVSFGRDGLSDTDTLQPTNNVFNDIYYEFGTDGVSRNFGKF